MDAFDVATSDYLTWMGIHNYCSDHHREPEALSGVLRRFRS